MASDYEIQIAKDENKASIYRALKFARESTGSLSLAEVVDVLKQVFDSEELKSIAASVLTK